MKKAYLILFGLLLLISANVMAQSGKKHKMVFQLATDVTKEHNSLTRQINNVLNFWPNAEIVVVVHSAALDFMIAEKSVAKTEIEKLMEKGVTFEVCQNTMKRNKVSEDQIIKGALFVPVGIAEIVSRQEKKYAYIKAGI